MSKPARQISVVGAGKPDPTTDGLAEEVGRRLAEAGATVVCGGLGGVMEAACRGAKAAGGTTVGILPGADRSGANPFVDVAVATGMGEARNAIVVRAADAIIAIGGEYGTLIEIGFALKIGRAVFGLRTWNIPGVVAANDPADAVARALA